MGGRPGGAPIVQASAAAQASGSDASRYRHRPATATPEFTARTCGGVGAALLNVKQFTVQTMPGPPKFLRASVQLTDLRQDKTHIPNRKGPGNARALSVSDYLFVGIVAGDWSCGAMML